jgi:3-deoxy-manno-octulosonate cytidylyltransferase (CMP-KDO synthetase)
MRTCIIIPARYRSTRFPGKPLVPLLGKPMILWVAELSAKAVGKSNVYIATEDDRIESVVKKFGFNTVMTSNNALTGTDRLAEASKQINSDIYLNVQGDEPLVEPEDIIKIRDKKLLNMNLIVNGFCWLSDDENPDSINIPKLITNEKNELIYMSRLALPHYKHLDFKPAKYKKQVCIYAFTKNELDIFNNFGRKSVLEKSEDIEILRFFELKKKILMVETSANSLAVDVPEDVPRIEKALRIKKKN